MYSPEIRNKLVDWYKADVNRTVQAAAQEFGMSEPTAGRILRQAKVKLHPIPSRTALTEAVQQKIVAWYLAEEERTIEDAAQEFYFSAPVIGKVIREAGVGKSVGSRRGTDRRTVIDDESKSMSNKSAIRQVPFRGSKGFRGHRRRSSL